MWLKMKERGPSSNDIVNDKGYHQQGKERGSIPMLKARVGQTKTHTKKTGPVHLVGGLRLNIAGLYEPANTATIFMDLVSEVCLGQGPLSFQCTDFKSDR